MKVVLTAEARNDLTEIGRYIRRDNPNRARTFVQEIADRCDELATMGRVFPVVPRFATRGVRKRNYENYLIFYRITDDAVDVLHVIHGARDWERLLLPPK
jgi:toxin ParE1/3/4